MTTTERMLRLGWRGWLYALTKASIGGAANAVVSSGVLVSLHPQLAEKSSWFVVVGWLFVASAATNAIYFLAHSPLPEPMNLEEGKDA